MMKTAKRLIAILLIAAMTVTFLASCNNGSGSTDGTTEGGDVTTVPSGTNPDPNTGSKVDYTVEIKSAGGLPLAGINVFVYSDNTLEDLEGFGTTDENGVAVIKLAAASSYAVTLSGVPAGYTAESIYGFNGTECKISLTSSVIQGSSAAGVTYKLGDVIHDFTVVTSDGENLTLSEVLKTKSVVLLNFWYTSCSYCIQEFPYMNSSYNQYKDKGEIVALNHYTGDSLEDIKDFKAQMALDFPMAKDNTAFQSAFDLQGYPTTVVVDRYGVICLVEAGGLPSEKPFNTIFELFTAENYTQVLYSSIDELIPPEKPDVEEHTSEEIGAVVNGGNGTFEFYGEKDDEMSWPFDIVKKDGVDCIAPSNMNKQSSYAILYVKVEMKKGDVFAFDYYSSTERYSDVLIVLADDDEKLDTKNFKDIYQISGQSTQWNTCFSYVAEKDGVFEISLCYQKDGDTNEGDDTVFIKNMRICSTSDITVPTYIPRFCANDPKANGFGYNSYVTVVFNEKDGYYHVGSENGPLLLVDFMKATRFSDTTIQMHALNGEITKDGVDCYEDLVPYLTLASNASINGLCPVDKELCELLKLTAECVGLEMGNENQWLQMCMYYDAYATGGVQLENPVMGLSNKTAYPAVLGDENYVYYDRVIMPRGLKYKFVPEQSGAYRITSLDSRYEVNAWIFLEDGSILTEYVGAERMYYDATNCSMVAYFEAGQSYYIDIAFYDVYQVGSFHFRVERLGDSYELFRFASPGYFTYYENESGGLNEIVALGIDVVLKDGYYYEKREDGSVGSLLYADFSRPTGLFSSNSILDIIEKGGFNFSISSDDEYILSKIKLYGRDKLIESLKVEWGEFYEEYYTLYKVEDVLDGKYHGKGPDLTEKIKPYIEKMIGASAEHPELEGCVPVTEELAGLLQALVDKYSFSGVEHSFTKLCYYYEYFGPAKKEEAAA